MLLELEQHSGPIIFSTNLIKNYDRAFERRIDYLIEFFLPTVKERLVLLERFIPIELPKHPELNLEELARESEGLSPADLKRAILHGAVRLFRPGRKIRAIETGDILAIFASIKLGKAAIASHDKIETIEEEKLTSQIEE